MTGKYISQANLYCAGGSARDADGSDGYQRRRKSAIHLQRINMVRCGQWDSNPATIIWTRSQSDVCAGGEGVGGGKKILPTTAATAIMCCGRKMA